MKKRVIAALMAVTLVASMAVGCGSSKSGKESADAGKAASSDKPIELIFTSVSVSGDSHTEAMTAFADKVEELSDGSIKCKTYSDGTLFSSENEFDALISGEADLAYLSFQTLSTQPGLEWCSMFGSGYFWDSYEHMTGTLNGEIGEEIFTKISDNINCTPLSAIYLGSRIINTRAKEVNSYEDMKGQLLRMPNSEAWLNLGEALGANPTPLSFSELYTALQTGAVDAQDNPLPTCISAKFYEVAPYFAITKHVVDSLIPCINTDTWNSMSDDQKKAVTEAMEYAKTVNDDLRMDAETTAIETLESEGCTVTYPEIKAYKEKVTSYYDAHADQTNDWDMDLYNRIQEEGKNYK